MTIELQDEFGRRQVRTLSRLCAYTLLAIFLISLLSIALPLPLADPQRSLGLMAELLERSTLPLVAMFFLFFGLSEQALPALWECRLAVWLRPLLLLVALFYLLTAIAIVGVSQRLGSTAASTLNTQVQATASGLQSLRKSVAQAPDAASLRRLLANQPALLQVLQQLGPSLSAEAPWLEQQQQLEQLLDRADVNLKRQAQQLRADASGNLGRRSIRLSLTAISYAIFYLLCSMIWPRSVAATLERIRKARLDQEDSAAQEYGIESNQA
jgi:hypothetical protein